MSQIKNVTTEMMLNEGAAETGEPWQTHMVARLHQLLAERDRAARGLFEIDRAIEELRREASEANAWQERLRADPGYVGTFAVQGEDLALRRLSPPDGIDERDLAECFARIMIAMRRRGEPLKETEFLVQFEPQSGRVVAISARRLGEHEWHRALYRRFNAAKRLDDA